MQRKQQLCSVHWFLCYCWIFVFLFYFVLFCVFVFLSGRAEQMSQNTEITSHQNDIFSSDQELLEPLFLKNDNLKPALCFTRAYQGKGCPWLPGNSYHPFTLYRNVKFHTTFARFCVFLLLLLLFCFCFCCFLFVFSGNHRSLNPEFGSAWFGICNYIPRLYVNASI